MKWPVSAQLKLATFFCCRFINTTNATVTSNSLSFIYFKTLQIICSYKKTPGKPKVTTEVQRVITMEMIHHLKTLQIGTLQSSCRFSTCLVVNLGSELGFKDSWLHEDALYFLLLCFPQVSVCTW